jgi:ABC-type multidrug transport system fused ATPase/permease subunit
VSQADARVRQRDAYAEDFVAALPRGADTPIGDRVAVMRQGRRIVELGRNDELISRGGPYARRYAARAA